MTVGISCCLVLICACKAICALETQNAELDSVRKVGESLNGFALNLLKDTNEIAGDSLNIALSPYTVWTLLLILLEGARENTEKQLQAALNVPADRSGFRVAYEAASKHLLQNSNGVQVDISNAIFTAASQALNKSFQQVSRQTYGVEVTPLDFNDKAKAAELINKYIAKATRNRITEFVNTDDLADAEVFLTSALYLKGQWKMPFNVSSTAKEPFYDSKGEKKGDVMMMFQVGPFAYAQIDSIKSHVLRLDYGNGEKMAMVVVLPLKGETLSSTLNFLSATPFGDVLKQLDDAQKEFGDEDVQVFLPKFRILSDFSLNIVLEKMGIRDVFNQHLANLVGLSPDYLYVSRIIQKAEIEVNEEGTVASSAAGGTLSYKTPPPKFYANRPFVYFIVNKETGSIIFEGKVSNPNGL